MNATLRWLHTRGLILDRQCRAGERFSADMEAAGASYATARLCEPTGGGREADDGCNPIVAAVTARGRLRSAVGHLGPGLSDVVILTSEGVPLKEIEERLQWPGRSAKVVLSLALDRLADHYGFL